ncbi:hypothetical protein [Janibacter sp. GXQ6167]|uniref:hypothetical protein n=1 Tax=Janibacter sp. GXQ6167 TaxID=3240791 RepID=UPI00352618D4
MSSSPAPREPSWPALLAALVVVLLYLALPDGLTLGPNWIVSIIAGVVLAILAVTGPARHPKEAAHLRPLTIALTAVLSVANASSAALLVWHLLGHGIRPVSGSMLISAGLAVWLSNIAVFALWYWEFDSGGPAARIASGRPAEGRGWMFAQDTVSDYPTWRPGFVDYLYLSITNQTAFSPTDTLPLRSGAKVLMGFQGLLSMVIIGLVVARAVNIL